MLNSRFHKKMYLAEMEKKTQRRGARQTMGQFEKTKNEAMSASNHTLWAMSAFARWGAQKPDKVDLFKNVPLNADRVADLTVNYLTTVRAALYI